MTFGNEEGCRKNSGTMQFKNFDSMEAIKKKLKA
jgi:hypothetical protein